MKKILLYTFLFCLVFSAIAGEVPTWEESKPVEKNEEYVDWDRSFPLDNTCIFKPSQKTWNVVKQSFVGDKLSFITTDMEFEIRYGRYKYDPNCGDEYEMKWAISAYYSQKYGDYILYYYNNIDEFIKKENSGKLIPVKKEFYRIARKLHPDKYFFHREYEKELQISCICVAFLFVLLILLLIRKIICRVFRMCRNLLLVFFSKENYFKTCILIFGFIITACMVIVAAHFL